MCLLGELTVSGRVPALHATRTENTGEVDRLLPFRVAKVLKDAPLCQETDERSYYHCLNRTRDGAAPVSEKSIYQPAVN